jgi:hypothetical protein
VVLYRAEKTKLELNGSESLTRRERHEATVIRGEAGFWLAEVEVVFGATETLTGFRARITQPDGSRQEFDAKSFLSDVSGKGERSVNAHFFRFPDVRVGSILEYWWVVEGERFWSADEQETLGRYPVKLYEFELTAAKPLVVETIEWNGASPIEVRSLASGEHQLRFSLRDLPPREQADFTPHFTFVEPRWAWRVLAWRDGKLSYDWLRDWKDVVDSNGKKFFLDDALVAGLELRLQTQGCADVPCLVGRAQALVREKVVGSARWNRAEPLAAVVSSGRASVVEQALLVRRLLEQAGVDAWLAYGTDALSQQVSPTFPRLEQFNHLFVYLPVQKGLAQPMTIDANCDFCAPGALTARHRDQKIYVFRTVREVSQHVTEGRWEVASGPAAVASERRFTHQARVEADGSISDEVTTRTVGIEALAAADDHRHRAGKLLQREADRWSESNGQKSMSAARWGTCERTEGRCEWTSTLNFPGQAWQRGDAWQVHLGFLSAQHARLFDAEERQLDVHFDRDDSALVEVVDLVAPPGTRLAALPPPVNVNAGSLRASVEVERTKTGARITRRLDRTLGFEPKSRYAELRAAADAFKLARFLVLEFAPEN